MATYKGNRKEFTRMATGAEMRRFVRGVGRYWSDELRQSAPVDSGAYRDSIRHEEYVHVIRGLPRAATRVLAGDEQAPYAIALEHGNRNLRNAPKPMTKLLDRIQALDPNLKPRG